MLVSGCVILKANENNNVWPTLSSLNGVVEEVFIFKKTVGFVAKYIWKGKKRKKWSYHKIKKDDYGYSFKGKWLLFLKSGEELVESELSFKKVIGDYRGYYLPVIDYNNIDKKVPYLELRLIKKEAVKSLNKFIISFSLSALKMDYKSSLGVLQIPILYYNRHFKNTINYDLISNEYNCQKGIEYLKNGKLNQAIYYLQKGWEKEQTDHILNLLFLAYVRKDLTIADVLDRFSPKSKNDIIKILEFYYNNNYLKSGLKLIAEIDMMYENLDSDFINYWQGLFWLKLGYCHKARLSFKKINPSFENYSRVLDIRWVMELKENRYYKKKGAKNQIKLLGDKLSCQYVSIFEGNGEVTVNFSSIAGKYMFFQRCLYYLELLIDFGYQSMQLKAEKIIKELGVRVANRELAWLYYHKNCLNKALPYVKKIWQEYHSQEYKLMLGVIYRKL